MDGSCTSQFFLEPKQTFQRQYEALRAIFVDAEPLDHVAVRFGYKSSALRSMVSRFRADCRRDVTPPFFSRMDADDHSGQVRARTARAPNRPRSQTRGS
jgi:CRISPR/Cas system Type II protein with McrA/HNH and RuvC-like nuclease domain